MAGYILKAAIKSPWITKKKALWKPQPKQSNPKICLFRHGNIKSSNEDINLFYDKLRYKFTDNYLFETTTFLFITWSFKIIFPIAYFLLDYRQKSH